ncbi:MAG: zinc ribbon domain-containing protein [Gammaproteobacteria bacterium]|nr:zinc ribbon domain-containing protein [Gammaproteobacteria bacterium]
MPIYEYVCDECEHQFETIQKISEDPLKTCPECDSESLRKKVSAGAFRLKGDGWYETDFKSGEKRNVATDEKKPSEVKSDGKKPDKDKSATDSGSKSTSSSSENKPTKSASSD